jgi:hypothetical protein
LQQRKMPSKFGRFSRKSASSKIVQESDSFLTEKTVID